MDDPIKEIEKAAAEAKEQMRLELRRNITKHTVVGSIFQAVMLLLATFFCVRNAAEGNALMSGIWAANGALNLKFLLESYWFWQKTMRELE